MGHPLGCMWYFMHVHSIADIILGHPVSDKILFWSPCISEEPRAQYSTTESTAVVFLKYYTLNP